MTLASAATGYLPATCPFWPRTRSGLWPANWLASRATMGSLLRVQAGARARRNGGRLAATIGLVLILYGV